MTFVFRGYLGIGRRGTGHSLTPLRVELVRSQRNRELLEAHYGCRAKFKSPRNALVFRASEGSVLKVPQKEEVMVSSWE